MINAAMIKQSFKDNEALYSDRLDTMLNELTFQLVINRDHNAVITQDDCFEYKVSFDSAMRMLQERGFKVTDLTDNDTENPPAFEIRVPVGRERADD